MSTIELLILGLALSMDAFAVTVSNAFVYRGTDKAHRLLMPVFFGVFQGLMPVIGFYAGSLVGPFIETYAGHHHVRYPRVHRRQDALGCIP